MESKTIAVYTDGSCLGNPGPGGWAFIGLDDKKVIKISGGEKHTTNNRMELLAVIKAIDHFRQRYSSLVVYSDSNLTIKCAEGTWKRRKNLDLWNEYDRVSKFNNIRFVWVKAHNGDKYNEMVDILARRACPKK